MSVSGVKGFLVRLPSGDSGGLATTRGKRFRARGVTFELRPLFAVPSDGSVAATGTSLDPLQGGWEWHLAETPGVPDSPNAWDVAHALRSAGGLAAAGAPMLVEPDFVQEWPYENPAVRKRHGSLATSGSACIFNDQVSDLPHIDHDFAWHLDDERTELRRARSLSQFGGTRIRIGHLDTGYDPNHQSFPEHFPNQVRTDLQHNFVGDQSETDAHDPGRRGILKNPGHGTGTLSILAGDRFELSTGGYTFDDLLGGAPDAEIVPIRIGTSVVQLFTSAVAKGINYAAQLCADETTRIHVISMSMGGVASAAWADAINMAYEAGIVFVAAAGNNFSAGVFGVPAQSIVYPARFRRVISACGVMANRRPYFGLPMGTMQGNWGPKSKMATAIAAYTPNIAWAELDCAGIVDMDGSGTSSSTPQVAAAAALYLQKHAPTLLNVAKYPEAWMRVEAVRQALFVAADKSADGGSTEKLGNGLLRVATALGLQPAPSGALHKTPRDSAMFPLLRVLTGLGAGASVSGDAMLALEATQLAHRWPERSKPNPIETATSDPDLPAEAIPVAELRSLLTALADHPEASTALKMRAQETRRALFGQASGRWFEPIRAKRRKRARPADVAAQAEAATQAVATTLPPAVSNPRPFVPARPAFRCLRGYAIDPSLATRLDTTSISEITFKVPWEPLLPGPIGEYLEVVDVDPGSGCFYEPIDLDNASILAQDGLSPSEGTPQFHQQMVYAVASLTIRNFERAMGRRSLWRPGPPPPGEHPKNDSVFVQRLRVYPHALREPNAFYSPNKIALLFGYFKAAADDAGDHVPGGMVFTSLSHDIVAHETSHALLDGMHRKFMNPTNPDVRAFHEAFADIVALLQHFTFPEVLTHQIARTQGDLRSHESLLGQLAGEFGRSTGLRGALRDAIGKNDAEGNWIRRDADPVEYEGSIEPHTRGSILVAAVFDAFLAIYGMRIADLLRLGSGGSGILAPGAIHPDLLGRLCAEAAKSAQHVLTMCIRGLDYCPPVDITFGEFLRAVVTADTDAVPDDDLHYRIAFVEAFRRRGIYPRDLRTLSPDSLLWRTPEGDELRPSQALQDSLQRLQPYASEFLFAQTPDGRAEPREMVFHLQRAMRRDIHAWLWGHITTHPEGGSDAAFLGIDPGKGFEVHTARFALRPSPDGDIDPQLLIGILQEVEIPIDPALPAGPTMTFEGGCTVIGDLRKLRIRYCVRKNVNSQGRQGHQQAFTALNLASARHTYFGDGETVEPFAAMHRRMER
jgi:subtilisin family serine protease